MGELETDAEPAIGGCLGIPIGCEETALGGMFSGGACFGGPGGAVEVIDGGILVADGGGEPGLRGACFGTEGAAAGCCLVGAGCGSDRAIPGAGAVDFNPLTHKQKNKQEGREA